jgi:DNA-binding beta-propeller fold protein YncE
MRPTPLLRAAAAALVVLAAPAPVAAQDAAALFGRLQEARRAADAGDHARAVALADTVAARLPDHPQVVLSRALVLARAGRADDAAREVRRLAAWDARYAQRALADSALAPVRARLADVDVAAAVERAGRPVARAHAWATLAERDLVPEGTAWDPATRAVLVGSLNKRKIVAIAPDGTVRDRVPSGRAGLASVVGIHVDARRGVLWATSNPRFDQPGDSTPAMLYAFDAATGRFRSRHPAPAPGPHFLNDLTTGPDGTVYVTDTRAARVWTLPPGAAALEPLASLAAAGELRGPNGITIAADGRHLFVADADHLRVVALAGPRRGASWRLAVPDSLNVAGIDGLAFVTGGVATGGAAAGDALVAHHVLAFWRIARYQLNADHTAIVGRSLLEANTADGRTATTGEVAGAHYVFIGNSQIDRMNARAIDSATMQPVRMYRVPLARPRGRELVAVALSARDSVALFDAETLERVAALPVGRGPHEIAASPDGARAYVADAGDTTITVIEAAPGAPRIAATWGLPDSIAVHDVSASADGRTVWAVSGGRRVALALDAATGRVRRRAALGRPGSWMIEARGAADPVVVAHLEGGAVTLLDPATGRQTVLEAREGEIDAAALPGGREVWSVNLRDGHVTVFDGHGGRVLAREAAGRGAMRVRFAPDGRTALVVLSGDSTLVALDARTRQRVGVAALPRAPKVLALSPDGRRAYLTHPEGETLTMVDVAAMAVLRTVPVPGRPDGVAVLGGAGQ